MEIVFIIGIALCGFWSLVNFIESNKKWGSVLLTGCFVSLVGLILLSSQDYVITNKTTYISNQLNDITFSEVMEITEIKEKIPYSASMNHILYKVKPYKGE